MPKTPADELPQLPHKVERFAGKLAPEKSYESAFDCYMDEVKAWLDRNVEVTPLSLSVDATVAETFAALLRARPEDVLEIAKTAVKLMPNAPKEDEPAEVELPSDVEPLPPVEIGIGMSDRTMTIGELMYQDARKASLG